MLVCLSCHTYSRKHRRVSQLQFDYQDPGIMRTKKTQQVHQSSSASKFCYEMSSSETIYHLFWRGTLYSTMQPLVWLPAVVLLLRPPAVRRQCYAATSAHVRIPTLWLVYVQSVSSSVYPKQAIHMLMLAHASLIAQNKIYNPNHSVCQCREKR